MVNGGALGTPSSGTVTNLTGTASININGTVGATTPTTGSFTTMKASTGAAVGGATPQSGGIAFPATQVSVSDANTLDDYEEGTFSPTANSFTVIGTPTLTGNYTKVGNLVQVWIYHFATTSVAAVAQTSNYSNLPYTVARNSIDTVMLDDQTVIGSGLVNASQGKAYIGSTIAATNRTITMYFSFQV